MPVFFILVSCICSGWSRRVHLPNPWWPSARLKVQGSVFTKLGADGDFHWMIEGNAHPKALYIFNDNTEDHYSARKGGGNAIIRPFNTHGMKPRPAKSAGVCTGSAGVGFQSLTFDVKQIIDRDIAEIRELLLTGNYDLILYSTARGDLDQLGTGIFEVGEDVKTYIVKQLKQFDGCSSSDLLAINSSATHSVGEVVNYRNALALHLLTSGSANLGRLRAGRPPPWISRTVRSAEHRMQFPDLFGMGKGASSTVVEISDSAPSWETLTESGASTKTGQKMMKESDLREKGLGDPHTDALLRLFDAKSEKDVRVTLYRDDAAWCPYCQKVWMLLEEKRIPFKVSKINMRSYGDKPAWFTDMVPGGFLPVIELDGKVITESLKIMQILDNTFPEGPPMLPVDDDGLDEANKLLILERKLFGAWCSLTFQPGKGLMGMNENNFLDTMRKVDDALLATPGPWFLGGDAPSLVDLQYISHIERMIASLLFWKGLKIRGTGKIGEFKGLDAWLAAFEKRPTYLATKSDYYTHCMDIPPQYGPGFSIDDAKECARTINGAAWELPLKLDDAGVLEPLSALQWPGEVDARHEAAWKLTRNHKNIVRFAARGAGKPGQKQFQAPLADPYAEPSDKLTVAVDVALRHVAAALLEGIEEASPAAKTDFASVAKGDDAERLIQCLAYLRDRIGVPRDMGQAAAFYLRAQLNWAIGLLSSD